MILVDQVQRLTLIVTKTGGTGLTVDYLEGTENKDVVVNKGTIGVTVDLGGSKGDADVFTGSANSGNDMLDARIAHDLSFKDAGSGYIEVKSGTDVYAELKDVDYIMVRDRAQGPEVTQAMIDAYTTNLTLNGGTNPGTTVIAFSEVTQEMINAWGTNQTLNGTTNPGTMVVASTVTQEMINAWDTNQTLNGTTNPGTSVVAEVTQEMIMLILLIKR